ncbi:MAG TPA: PorV/PorQ family protein [Gemmatimonadaceae bacterium]|nr:PorV/PorQ family protein [Gemmatimonadaceae bacterium]
MRQFLRHVIIGAAFSLAAAATLGAQTGTENESAFEFIFPYGARAVAMGMTGVAMASPSDAVWLNPALVARAHREASLQEQSKLSALISTDIGGSVVWTFAPVGTVALSARYMDEGTDIATNDLNEQTGTFVPKHEVVAATFATTFGSRATAGFTVKRLVRTAPCSGECGPNLPASSSVNALDFGAQFYVSHDSVLSVGLAARNIGPKLQQKDAPQADELPTRIEAGIAIMPTLKDAKDVRVIGAADIVARVGPGAPGFRFGGEVGYQNRYFGRAGYVVYGPGEVSGATFGVGVQTGKLAIDLSQMATDPGTSGLRPTLVSLRYIF